MNKCLQWPQMGSIFEKRQFLQALNKVKKYAFFRHETKTALCSEQKGSKRHLGLAQWLGWACFAISGIAVATPCTQPPIIDNARPGFSGCECNDMVFVVRELNQGELDLSLVVHQCADEYDTTCAEVDLNNIEGTHYFKNRSEENDYFSCDWTPGSGYSNPENYTPKTHPLPGEVPPAPSSLLVYFALFGLMLTVIVLVGGLIYVLRKQNQPITQEKEK
jgi:hypothetical protein